MRAPAALLLGLVAPLAAHAGTLHLVLEPVQVGIERLDAVYDAAGLDTRTAARLGWGAALEWNERLALAAGVACAAGTTDFGLLAAPTVRLERRDVEL